MSEPFLTNIRECRECFQLFMVLSDQPMRGPGKYPLSTCRICGKSEHEAPDEVDESEEEE